MGIDVRELGDAVTDGGFDKNPRGGSNCAVQLRIGR